MDDKKLNILVLTGGESTEREVALKSAAAIVDSLSKSGHNVRILDTLNGSRLTYQSGQLLPAETASAVEIPSVPATVDGKSYPLSVVLSRNRVAGVDVVFNALHGGTGENGAIQAVLDLLGVPYTGSPMAASAIAMNKDITKRVMRSLEIPTADWKKYDGPLQGHLNNIVADIKKNFREFPMVVKPNDGGSTVGLTLVETEDQIPAAVETAFAVSPAILVEKYFKGREITIAVLDGQPLPAVEIKPTHKIYDYTCKYTKGKSQYICPAEIENKIYQQLSDDAVRLYNAIDCRGYSRIDFIIAADGSYICLELNTLPGMTALSLFPMAARAAGMNFDELLDRLCQLAMRGR
jgi:D-alanine-D-alanine ligase